MEARSIRTAINGHLATIRRASLMLSKAWKVDVGEASRHGYTLPEASTVALRGAYETFELIERRARMARVELEAMVAEVHGPETLAFMREKWD